MNDDTLQALCEEIVNVLRGQPLGMSQADIHANVKVAESPRDTARAIQTLKERGTITAEVNGQWRMRRGGAGREGARKKNAATAPQRRSLIESILAVLGDKEMTAREVADLINESQKRVRENLTVNKDRYGLAVVSRRGIDGVWKRVDPGKAPPPRKTGAVSRETALAAKDTPKRNSAPAARRDDAAKAALERAAQQAQASLDDYVASVCDPNILAALRQMRDAAREALRLHAGEPQ